MTKYEFDFGCKINIEEITPVSSIFANRAPMAGRRRLLGFIMNIPTTRALDLLSKTCRTETFIYSLTSPNIIHWLRRGSLGDYVAVLYLHILIFKLSVSLSGTTSAGQLGRPPRKQNLSDSETDSGVGDIDILVIWDVCGRIIILATFSMYYFQWKSFTNILNR